ncbi:LYR motif-containing protein 2-like [Dysidea avara]|uniref:LYR motif-containing protein 2-like n=1 Tax=Dysidea avara TaxID=196820 RepID=UPI003325ADEC
MAEKFMTFKQFLLRRETLQLYRQFLKVLLKVEDKQYRGQLRVWIRTEFEVAGSQGDHDEEAVRMRLTHARLALKELKTSVYLATS